MDPSLPKLTLCCLVFGMVSERRTNTLCQRTGTTWEGFWCPLWRHKFFVATGFSAHIKRKHSKQMQKMVGSLTVERHVTVEKLEFCIIWAFKIDLKMVWASKSCTHFEFWTVNYLGAPKNTGITHIHKHTERYYPHTPPSHSLHWNVTKTLSDI